jgi:RHS repeat-associated protein
MLLTDDGEFDSYAYDAAGRPIERSAGGITERFEYDSLGQLVRFEREGATPSVVELQYNHANLLSRIDADGQVREFLWDVTREVPQLLEERNGDGTLIRRYVYGLGPIGVFDGASKVLHLDRLGSVRMVTADDGAVQAQYAYAAYGDQTQGAGDGSSSLRFAGELFIPELNMYYLRARFYDPGAGRFLTPDLFKTLANQPQTFNPFLYANANPLRFTDPMGTYSLSSVTVSIAIVNILVGIALPHFPQPVLMIAKGLGLTQADAQVGISLALAISQSWATGGLQFDFLYGPDVWQVVIWVYAGAQIGSARGDPRLSSPQVTFWLGSIYGAANSNPGDPRAGIYLLITGNVAVLVGDYATKGRFRNVRVSPSYGRSAAGIQFEIGGISKSGEIGSTFFQAFALYGSPWGALTMPPIKIKRLDRQMRFAGGLSLTVYLPVFWFTWNGQEVEADSWFSGW